MLFFLFVWFVLVRGKNLFLIKCKTLDNYSIFVEKIREYLTQGLKLEELITPVIEYCIKNNILKKFLKENSSEVRNMIFGEYDRDMDILIFFGIPTVPFLIVFIYAMRKIAKDKKTA